MAANLIFHSSKSIYQLLSVHIEKHENQRKLKTKTVPKQKFYYNLETQLPKFSFRNTIH